MLETCCGCAGQFSRAVLEEAAQALFCSACLLRLQRRIDDRSPSRAALEAKARATPADAPCFLCGGPIDERASQRLCGFRICTACEDALGGGKEDE
jgi:hypothetical protein